jgi:putative DNA primase/helicase
VHPYLLNFQNGTLDLKTRMRRPHDPADLLTKVIEHNYDPSAAYPNFMRYLEGAQPDPEVREWLHRRDGSSLTADCSDQIFVVHYGDGATGKGTHYRVLKHVLGDYVVKAPRSVFEAQRQRQHPADLMTLAGRRLAYGSEIAPYLNVDQIKELTGEEDFQARGMGENFSEQRGNCKLEVMMNKAPIVREDPDDGIWRRLRIVPWSVKFEGEQRDNRLFDKLKSEAEGILAWLVRGCYLWMDEGLTEPAAIMHATEEFAAEQDHITPFLDEVCDTSDPDALVLADDLFKARQAWNASRNERPGESQKAFGDALKARGILHGPPHPKTRRTRWKGITLRQGIFLFNVQLEAPGLCVMTQEEEDDIRDVLASAREQEERRELHLRLLEAV